MPTRTDSSSATTQAGVTPKPSDRGLQVVNTSATAPTAAMVDQVRANLGRKPRSVPQMQDLLGGEPGGMETRKIKAYIARSPEARQQAATHAKNGKPGSLVARMREKLNGADAESLPASQQIVEPVFGQIKQAMGSASSFRGGQGPGSGAWSALPTTSEADESDCIRVKARKLIDFKPPRSLVETESWR